MCGASPGIGGCQALSKLPYRQMGRVALLHHTNTLTLSHNQTKEKLAHAGPRRRRPSDPRPIVRITQSNSHISHAQVLRCTVVYRRHQRRRSIPALRLAAHRALTRSRVPVRRVGGHSSHYFPIVSSAWVSTRAFSLRPPSPCTSRMSMPAALAARFSAFDCAIRVSLSVR